MGSIARRLVDELVTNRTARRHTPKGTPMHKFSKGQFFPLNKEASPGLRTVALGVKDRSPGTQNRAGTPMHHWGVAIANGDPSAGARRQGDELYQSLRRNPPKGNHQCIVEERFIDGTFKNSTKGHSPTGTTLQNHFFMKTFRSKFLEKHFSENQTILIPRKLIKS